jgi:hypothetical protein
MVHNSRCSISIAADVSITLNSPVSFTAGSTTPLTGTYKIYNHDGTSSFFVSVNTDAEKFTCAVNEGNKTFSITPNGTQTTSITTLRIKYGLVKKQAGVNNTDVIVNEHETDIIPINPAPTDATPYFLPESSVGKVVVGDSSSILRKKLTASNGEVD